MDSLISRSCIPSLDASHEETRASSRISRAASAAHRMRFTTTSTSSSSRSRSRSPGRRSLVSLRLTSVCRGRWRTLSCLASLVVSLRSLGPSSAAAACGQHRLAIHQRTSHFLSTDCLPPLSLLLHGSRVPFLPMPPSLGCRRVTAFMRLVCPPQKTVMRSR